VRSRIDLVETAPLAGATLAVRVVGIVSGRLGRRLGDVSAKRIASAVPCAFRFNPYFVLAIVITVAAGMCIPSVTSCGSERRWSDRHPENRPDPKNLGVLA